MHRISILGLISTRRDGGAFFLSCSSLHDRPCILIMHASLNPSYPSPPNPFCSVTAQGPRTVEIGPSGVLFLTSLCITAEDLAHTPLHPPCFLLSEDIDRRTIPVPGVEGAWEAGGPVVVSQPPGLPSSAYCSV